MKYKATIILPCYNKEKFITRALDSIISLSRFKDFEVILVDDHSKDNTVKLIEKYEKKYKNIKLYKFSKGSGSPSKPRNFGIEKSNADYLIFMDPDDQIINDGYSTLLTKMEEYQSDILIGTRILVNEYGKKVWTDFIYEDGYINSNSYDIKFDLLNRPPVILKTIYKKSLIIDNDIKFNEKITTSEDEAFDIKCIAHATKITKINDIVYQYTAEAEGSITTNVSLKIYEQAYDVLKELDEAYSLIFSKEIIAKRFIDLFFGFYIKKITFFKTNEEIEKASKLIYEAFKKYGFEKFNALKTKEYKEKLEDLKNQRLTKYINKYFIDRFDILSNRYEKLDNSYNELNEKYKKLDNNYKDLNKKYSLLNNRKDMLEEKNSKLIIENKKNKKMLNRKVVKLAVKIAKALSKIKKKISYNKEN